MLRPKSGERSPLTQSAKPTLLVPPGSRKSEVRRLLEPFGETVRQVREAVGPLDLVLPAVSHQIEAIRDGVRRWPVAPVIVEGEQAKYAAFRRAHAALAASGTVTLELALSGVPLAVAYRLDPLAKRLRFLFLAHSIVLTNLILGENIIPELVNDDCTPDKLAEAVVPLLRDSPERRRQLSAFERLDDLMTLGDTTPSRRAANVVLATHKQHQRRFETGT